MQLLTHNEWVNDVAGRYVDDDGAHGGQCWDTFADYCRRVLGIAPVNTWGGNWSGWAYAIWDQYAVNGAAGHFDKIPATWPTLPGDIPIWTDTFWQYPASHIAVTHADAGASVLCVSQNSSPAQPWLPGYHPDASGPNTLQYLTKQGLAGYLRRRPTHGLVVAGEIVDQEDIMAGPIEITDIQAESIVQSTVDRLWDRIDREVLDKADGAYTNSHVLDLVQAVGRIEGQLGTKLDKSDGHTLRMAILESSKGDPAAMAREIVAAVGEDLAKDVVAELGKALIKGGTA